MLLYLEQCQQEARWSDFTMMLIRAPGTLALISETSWALQWLIGALPAGWVWTRHAWSPLRGWHLETKKCLNFDGSFVFIFSSVCFLWRLFEAYGGFPASLTWFEPLAVFSSLLHIGGGHRPHSSCKRMHSYFLLLEDFARVKKKIWGDRICKVECLFRVSSLSDCWFSLVI